MVQRQVMPAQFLGMQRFGGSTKRISQYLDICPRLPGGEHVGAGSQENVMILLLAVPPRNADQVLRRVPVDQEFDGEAGCETSGRQRQGDAY